MRRGFMQCRLRVRRIWTFRFSDLGESWASSRGSRRQSAGGRSLTRLKCAGFRDDAARKNFEVELLGKKRCGCAKAGCWW